MRQPAVCALKGGIVIVEFTTVTVLDEVVYGDVDASNTWTGLAVTHVNANGLVRIHVVQQCHADGEGTVCGNCPW